MIQSSSLPAPRQRGNVKATLAPKKPIPARRMPDTKDRLSTTQNARRMQNNSPMSKNLSLLLSTLLVVAVTGTPRSVLALEKAAGEAERLKQCERAICKMILLKEPTGKNLNCDLTKTWLKSDIVKGGKRGVRWGFGDAQCTTTINIPRATIIAAMTQKKATLMLKGQKAVCKVERGGEVKTVRAILSPKLKTKRGRANKLWINLKELEGPADIKGTVWTAAGLADSLGLFHKNMIKGINKFAHVKCHKKFGEEFGLKPKKAKPKN